MLVFGDHLAITQMQGAIPKFGQRRIVGNDDGQGAQRRHFAAR